MDQMSIFQVLGSLTIPKADINSSAKQETVSGFFNGKGPSHWDEAGMSSIEF
jgi:hypothetical protein